MPIFMKNGRKVMFVHIPKAAGTSVEKFFTDNKWHTKLVDVGTPPSINSVLKCSPQHMHMDMLEAIINFDNIDCQFAVVRNPISRIVSEYNWRVKFFNVNLSIDEFIINALDSYKSNNFIYDNHIRPQVEFVSDKIKIFRLEDGINEIPIWLQRELGSKQEINLLPHAQSSKMKNNIGKSTLSESTLELIYDFYKDDFKAFGYDL